MGKYLTYQQYLNADDGILTPDLPSPLSLERFIRRCESLIDIYMGFDPRLGGFELGNRVYAREWDMKSLKTRLPNFPVPIIRVNNYQIQVSTVNSSGQGFYAIINTGDMNYNQFSHYIEITPLQSVTYSLSPVMMAFGLRPPIIRLEYESGFYLPYFNELVDDSGDHTTYWARRGQWATTNDLSPQLNPIFQALPIPYTIFKNGSAISSGFTVDPVNGTVVFTVANAVTDVITASYCSTIPDSIRDATIAQVTWLLGQRRLHQQGVGGTDYIRTGNDFIRRKAPNQKRPNALCEDAITYLDEWKEIAIAG